MFAATKELHSPDGDSTTAPPSQSSEQSEVKNKVEFHLNPLQINCDSPPQAPSVKKIKKVCLKINHQWLLNNEFRLKERRRSSRTISESTLILSETLENSGIRTSASRIYWAQEWAQISAYICAQNLTFLKKFNVWNSNILFPLGR